MDFYLLGLENIELKKRRRKVASKLSFVNFDVYIDSMLKTFQFGGEYNCFPVKLSYNDIIIFFFCSDLSDEEVRLKLLELYEECKPNFKYIEIFHVSFFLTRRTNLFPSILLLLFPVFTKRSAASVGTLYSD